MSLTILVSGAPLRMGMSSDAVRQLQQALRSFGHELVVDGGFGAVTRDAVLKFQGAHGLAVDGVVGTRTAAAIDALLEANPEPLALPPEPLASIKDAAPWLSTMRAVTGTKEVPGSKDNPLILAWRDEIARRYPDLAKYCAGYTHDSIAWCGLGMAYVMAVNGVRPDDTFLWAQSWANWGVPLKEPTPGAVLVFTRKGGGHVALYESETASHWFIRGANQSDMVNCSARSKALGAPIAIRWPAGFALPTSGRKLGKTANAVAAGSEA